MNKSIRISQIAKPYSKQIFNEVALIIHHDYEKLVLNNPKFKEGFRILTVLETRIQFIVQGILDLVLADNLYSAKILLRSLIEYIVKLEFLIKKSQEENGDTIFNEYLIFNDLLEELQYLKWRNINLKLITKVKIDQEALDDLIKRKPEIKEYSEKLIFEKANQFSFNNMFKFINELRDRTSTFPNKIEKDSFLHLGPLYSELSSFVHGGIGADTYLFLKYLDSKEKEIEISELVEHAMGVNFYATILFVDFCNKIDKKYESILELIFDKQLEYYRDVDSQ